MPNCNPSEWCCIRAELAEAVGDTTRAKAYRTLEAIWRQREDEKRAKQSCVCGKSETGQCQGICARGE